MGIQKDTIEVINTMAKTVSEQVTAAVSANVSKQVVDLKMYVVEEFAKDRERISNLEIFQDLQGNDIKEIKAACIATHPRKASNSMVPRPEKPAPSTFAARAKVWIPVGTGIAIGIGVGIKAMFDAGWF